MASTQMARLLRLFALLALPCAVRANPSLALENSLLRLPRAGDTSLTVLSPTFLEVMFVTAPQPGEIPPVGDFALKASFAITVDGKPATIKSAGFKRRVLYAPVKHRDLRVSNWVYLELANPLPAADHISVNVRTTQGGLWPADLAVSTEWTPLRYNPAVHVNQEGYTTGFSKIGMIGYYLGSEGELPVPANAGFSLVDAKTGATAFTGNLRRRRDVGFASSPLPYQQVSEADFSKFDQPGDYRLVVPGFGASLPFRIDDGILMNFVRAYALGLYHQRCGTTNEEPYTRFTHAACHVAPADIPVPSASFAAAWKIIGSLHDKKPPGPAHELKDEASQLYPFVKKGKIDVSGGHHDAGDYSKYTINSAALIHTLMFAVDALPGVADLDNLGLPESGDGISDILQEAKWESDFI
ncbi:MAG TPA: glycoside hydrolase family 9 protein, partial [Candidatus Limnocylindria bacterium]|nr:glycoside hydrolase family 9 protein [Candidatus Limnocylindria bacterium]